MNATTMLFLLLHNDSPFGQETRGSPQSNPRDNNPCRRIFQELLGIVKNNKRPWTPIQEALGRRLGGCKQDAVHRLDQQNGQDKQAGMAQNANLLSKSVM